MNSSQNNLKQLGLALHNFHDAYQYFPHGYREVAGVASPLKVERRRESWYQLALPYMEQTALYDLYMADTTGFNAGNNWDQYIHQMTGAQVAATVPVMSCPSDGQAPGKGANGGTTAFQGSYAVSAGAVNWSTPTAPTQMNMASGDTGGMFYHTSRVRMTDIPDGTSNTLMVSEGIIRNNGSGGWGELGGVWGGAPHGSYAFSTYQLPNTSVADRVYTCKGGANTTVPGAPNGAPCESGNTLGLTGRWNFARSYHTGGVNAGLGDGSVRFISNNTDLQSYRAMGTRNDGLVITQ